jgi:hypothetical protein
MTHAEMVLSILRDFVPAESFHCFKFETPSINDPQCCHWHWSDVPHCEETIFGGNIGNR